jgi:hypothetical protein
VKNYKTIMHIAIRAGHACSLRSSTKPEKRLRKKFKEAGSASVRKGDHTTEILAGLRWGRTHTHTTLYYIVYNIMS